MLDSIHYIVNADIRVVIYIWLVKASIRTISTDKSICLWSLIRPCNVCLEESCRVLTYNVQCDSILEKWLWKKLLQRKKKRAIGSSTSIFLQERRQTVSNKFHNSVPWLMRNYCMKLMKIFYTHYFFNLVLTLY